MMKAFQILEATNPPKYVISQIPKPKPAAGQVVIKVMASNINPVDYKVAYGLFPMPLKFPWTPGMDLSGIVDQVAEDVSDFKVGDDVVCAGDFLITGAYAEYALADAITVFHKPKEVSFEDAAAMPCAGLTAYHALFRRANIRAGDVVVILGAAGGVGGYAVQLAKNVGCKVIGTCSKNHFEYVRGLGADEVIDYHSEDVAKRVKELTGGRGAETVFDCIGPQAQAGIFEMVRLQGHIVGIMGFPEMTKYQMFSKAVSIHEVFLGGVNLQHDLKGMKDMAVMGTDFMKLMKEGKVKSFIHMVIPLEKLMEGFELVKDGHVHGKVIVKI